MALLTCGSTEFARSTGHIMPGHFKSGKLKKLLRAISMYQQLRCEQNLATVLVTARAWQKGNPREVKFRGRLLPALFDEIVVHSAMYNMGQARTAFSGMRAEQEVQTQARGADSGWAQDVRHGADELARVIRRAEILSLPSAPGAPEDSLILDDRVLHQKFPVLRQIEITDLPTGAGPGRYTHTADDTFTVADRNKALGTYGVPQPKEGGKPDELLMPQYDPKYWLILGKLVTLPKNGKYFGRCLSCAAAVIKCLIEDPIYDDLMIEHVGAINSDHHLVLVGRQNANGVNSDGLNGQQNLWGEGVVIDVWQGNLNHTHKYVYTPQGCKYVNGKKLKFFCAFKPEDRKKHRADLAALHALRPPPVAPRVQAGVLQHRGDTSTGQAQNFVKRGGGWVLAGTA